MPTLFTASVFAFVCVREQTNLRIIKYKLYASLFVLLQALGVNILKKLLLPGHVTYTPCMLHSCRYNRCSFLVFGCLWQVTGCRFLGKGTSGWFTARDRVEGPAAGIATFWQRHKENVIIYALEQTTATTSSHSLSLAIAQPLLSRQQQFI